VAGVSSLFNLSLGGVYMESILVQQIVNGLIVGSYYGLMATGLTMIFGVMKITNFAHGEFLMFGAYVAIYSTLYFTGLFGWMGAMFFAAVGVGILGFIIEKFLFRPLLKRNSDIDTIMLSVGLSILLANGAHLLFGATPRMLVDPFASKNVNFFFFSTSLIRIFSFIFAIISIVALQLFLSKSKVGTAIRAVSQNRNSSILMGIDTNFIYGLTFVLGSALAGISGVLSGTIFSVSPTMGALPTLKAFAITILGGMGSVRGAILGGFILGVAETLGGNYISMDYKNAIGFIIMIITLLVWPQGLFGRRSN
jgi:branched-chain amino acid transport system permease protein